MVNIFEAYIKYGLDIFNNDIKRGISLIRVGLEQTILNYGHLKAERLIYDYKLSQIGFNIK